MEFPENVVAIIKSDIPRDRDRSSPTAKLIQDKRTEAMRLFVFEFWEKHKNCINNFKLLRERANTKNGAIVIHLSGLDLCKTYRLQCFFRTVVYGITGSCDA